MMNKKIIIYDKKFQKKKSSKNKENYKKPIPLELSPVIDAILAYGRKTNALGHLNVIDILEGIVKRIKFLNLHEDDDEIKKLISLSEETIQEIRNNFNNLYENG